MVTLFEPLFGHFVELEDEVCIVKCIAEMNKELCTNGYLSFGEYYDILCKYDKSEYLINNPRPVLAYGGYYSGFTMDLTNQNFSYYEGVIGNKKCYIIRYPSIGSSIF